MKIVVLLSDGIYGLKPVFIESVFRLYERNLVHVVNRNDLYAMDLAVNVKVELEGVNITTISVGNERAEELVRRSMIKGADRGIWGDCEGISMEASYDIASVLGNIVEMQIGKFDLLLMGNNSQDHAFGVVGSLLAKRFGIRFFGHITAIESVRRNHSKAQFDLTLNKLMEKGDRLVFGTETPAIIAVEGSGKGTNEICLDDLLARKSRPIEKIEIRNVLDSTGAYGKGRYGEISFEGYYEPRRRPKKIFVPDSSLDAAERLRQITFGNVPKRNTNIIDGEVEHVSEELIRYLRQNRLIS